MSGGPNASLPVPQPDGSGGGAFFGRTLDLLTGRALMWVDGEISRRFGGGMTETVTVNTAGQVRPESQPGTPAPSTVSALLKSPTTWVIVGAGIALGILLWRR